LLDAIERGIVKILRPLVNSMFGPLGPSIRP
jgi:hypothetical protein